MRKKTINSKAFNEACRKAGLDIATGVGNISGKGIKIKDAQGNVYVVNQDMQIVKVSVITGEGMDIRRAGIVRRARKNIRANHNEKENNINYRKEMEK